jgi:hypothetical protein
MGAVNPWPAYVLAETVSAFLQLQEILENQFGISIGIAEYGGFRALVDLEEILAFRSSEFDNAVAAGEIAASTDINAWRPIAPYGHSFHNYGAAFDIRVKPGGGGGYTDEQVFAIAGRFVPALGLRWGGTFPNPDTDHFELDVSLSEARSMFSSEFPPMAATVAGDVSQFDLTGIDDNTAGDDSGESALELGLEAQQNRVLWLVAGAAIASLLAVWVTRR